LELNLFQVTVSKGGTGYPMSREFLYCPPAKQPDRT
jgi:hypothetical protein